MFNKIKRESLIKILIFSGFFILCFSFLGNPPDKIKAAGSITVTSINYIDSTITLKANAADTELYFSDYRKKVWDKVPGVLGSDKTIVMDISWIAATRDYVITFKGNASTDVLSVTIPKQVSNLKVSYNKSKGTLSFYRTQSRMLQWRKKQSTVWNSVDTNTISSEVGYLCENGAVIYFRLAPVNGFGVTNVGYRPSKEVSVTIPKKVSAPVVAIDGSAFNIPAKKNMSYRMLNSDGTATQWINIYSNSNLLLHQIAGKAMYSAEGAARSEVTLQFRSNATSSRQVSKISTITVPIQKGPPDEDANGITLTYTSSKTLSLQVKAASSTVPFEYAVVKKYDTLDYQTAKWTSITSAAEVSLNNKTAPEGAHIYIRKALKKESDTESFALASAEVNISGAEGVSYPETPEASSLTNLISIAGRCKLTDSSSYLSFVLYSSTQTTVSSISFMDSYGIEKGSVTCKSTVARNSGSTGPDNKYIITTKITSTANIDSITERLLYAKIILANSDVIASSDSTGVRLYLYPGSGINNPVSYEDKADYKSYSTDFTRVYLSNDAKDETGFKFQIDYGTQYIVDTTTIGQMTSNQVAIASIKYDNYTLISGTDYSVIYGSYINDDNKTIATATVTVDVSKFEAYIQHDSTNSELPLVIKLNNGEKLEDDIHLTLKGTAVLDVSPVAWSITEGSLKETRTTKITNEDGTTETVTEEVIDFILTLSLFDSTYGVSISDVTWDGISIFDSAKVSGGTATIYLSNKKINKLNSDATTTNNIIISFSNGYKIKTGCKLTILDGDD